MAVVFAVVVVVVLGVRVAVDLVDLVAGGPRVDSAVEDLVHPQGLAALVEVASAAEVLAAEHLGVEVSSAAEAWAVALAKALRAVFAAAPWEAQIVASVNSKAASAAADLAKAA